MSASSTRRDGPPGLLDVTGRVAARYATASKWSRNFVRGKLLTDPATPAVLRLAHETGGFGEVADLGCGRGQVGLALLLAGLAGAGAGARPRPRQDPRRRRPPASGLPPASLSATSRPQPCPPATQW
jgi:hypothetical protein